MLELNKVSALFTDIERANRWISIETAFIKYIFSKGGIDSVQTERVFLECPISTFEVIHDVARGTKEHEEFKKVFLSKSRKLNDPKFKNGLDYLGLVNTGNSLLIRDWHEIMLKKLNELQNQLKSLAIEYKGVVQIGRTHGIHGEPTSLGFRFASTYDDLDKYIEFIFDSRKYLEVVTFDANNLADPECADELLEFLTKELGLLRVRNNGRSVSSGRYLSFLGNLNGIAQVIHKQVSDLFLLSSDELGEVKASPEVIAEMTNIELSARLIDDYLTSYVNLDTSLNSQSYEFCKKKEEYMVSIMKETTNCIYRFSYVLANIKFDLKTIDKNLAEASESIYSQKTLLYLVQHTPFRREDIAEDIKQLSQGAKKPGASNFRTALAFSKYNKYFKKEDLDTLFDKDSYIVNIDKLYEKIFAKSNKLEGFKKILWSEHQINYHIDVLSGELNKEYAGNRNQEVALVVFGERSLVFAGNLMLKLDFPVDFVNLSSGKDEVDLDYLRGKRVLIVDFLVSNNSNLPDFVNKLSDLNGARDVRLCSLLKFNDVSDENVVVDWFAIECSPDDFYAGFGKDCSNRSSYRHYPAIGLII